MAGETQLPEYLPKKMPGLVFSDWVNEELAKRIAESLSFVEEEYGIAEFDIEPVAEDVSVLEYYDLKEAAINWIFGNKPWPKDIDYIKFFIKYPSNIKGDYIKIEIGPCENGKCLIETYWY